MARNSFFAEQMNDPEYAAEVASERARIDAVDSILRRLDAERERQGLSKAELARLADKTESFLLGLDKEARDANVESRSGGGGPHDHACRLSGCGTCSRLDRASCFLWQAMPVPQPNRSCCSRPASTQRQAPLKMP